jgi:hypothetical protein
MTHTKLAEISDELAEEAAALDEMLPPEEALALVRDLARGYELTPEIEIGLLKHLETCQEEEELDA